MVGTRPGNSLPNWQPLNPPATPPPHLDSLLIPLLHQCPTQRGQYTHPAFVGQECQESRLLPSSPLLPNKVLSPLLPLTPHLTSAICPPRLRHPGGFRAQPAGCLGGCVWFDVVLSLHTVTSALQSGATTPAVRK